MKSTALSVLAALALLSPPAAKPKQVGPGFQAAFPRDHGAHPGFNTEWWYVTGHLWSPEGRRFGFELTFFRLEPKHQPEGAWPGNPQWRTDEIHLAHAALTDLGTGTFRMEERVNRAGLMAGAAEGDLDVFNENWSLRRREDGSFELKSSTEGRQLSLSLEPETPPVRFGQGGYLQKGPDPGTGSYYFTFPRLKAQGNLAAAGGTSIPLSGMAWMDHEISSMQLAPGIAGWNWAGVQLRDGRSLMVYQLRGEDGSISPWSLLSEIDAQGRVRRTSRDFTFESEGTWSSPRNRARYPLPIRLRAWGESWTFTPILQDQEMKTRFASYWEGACTVRGADGSELGNAYVELTGYAESMQGRI